MNGKFTIGADAAAAAGPVGRNASAATDAQLSAEILSYSRSRGLFAGVALDGTAIQVDGGANQAYYGNTGFTPAGPVVPQNGQLPQSAIRLMNAIAQYSGGAVPAQVAQAANVAPAGAMPANLAAAPGAMPAGQAAAAAPGVPDLAAVRTRAGETVAATAGNAGRQLEAFPGHAARVGHRAGPAVACRFDGRRSIATKPSCETRSTRHLPSGPSSAPRWICCGGIASSARLCRGPPRFCRRRPRYRRPVRRRARTGAAVLANDE